MQRRSFLYSALMLLTACGGDLASTGEQRAVQGAAAAPVPVAVTSTVALAGNAFITTAARRGEEEIGDGGLANWSSSAAITSVYFHVASAGAVTLELDASLAGSKKSSIRVTANNTPFTVNLAGSASKTYAVGVINVAAPGYVRVDLQGISKDGGYFGDVSALKVTSTAKVSYANDAANYYWSRRGPSVHMTYTTPANTEYFYNEVTVPVGQDPIGSYYMANGFDGGYFGMQVKSAAERWILFSVWDADNGEHTTLVSKGAGVVDNGFGGEGTGGQSYLVYNWIAGNTYRFITQARPDGAGGTNFSAWFFAPETGSWRYIATWNRPATVTNLTGNYSFLENFEDTKGYLARRVQFGNQWARNTAGAWTEVRTARFSGDDTASNAQRLDYAGGLDSGRFYLRNGGFVAGDVALNQDFVRRATGQQPVVDVDRLPR